MGIELKPIKNPSIHFNKIRTIMKSSMDGEVSMIREEAIAIVSAAMEMFIQFLVKNAYEKSADKQNVDYNELVETVASINELEFLKDILPKKISVKEFRELMKDGISLVSSDDDECEEEESNKVYSDSDDNKDVISISSSSSKQ